MVKKKAKSKRTTLKQKFKVQKRVKEHNRKKKKEANRKGPGGKTKKRDPGIPNSWPFKAELLAQLEAAKEKRATKKLKSVEDLAQSAKERNENYVEDSDIAKNDTILSPELERSRRSYGKQVAKLIETTDVILQVLDARDPLGSHSEELEAQIVPPKRLVLVLNKIDLVPREIAQRWLDYLRKTRGFVVMPCAARPLKHTIEKEDLGLDGLVQLLKSYGRDARLLAAVVGFPNTGKSSLVQALVRRRSSDSAITGIDATAGSTTNVREVKLDKKVTLVDSPGIIRIPPRDAAKRIMSLAARGCIEATDLSDAPAVAADLLSRCSDHEALGRILGAQCIQKNIQQPLAALAALGRARGRLKKSGVVDLEAAAKDLLADFKSGRLPFYVEPPAVDQDSTVTDLKLVSTMAQAFDPLAQDDIKVLSAAAGEANETAIALDLYNGTMNDVDMQSDEDDDDDMAEDDDNDDDMDDAGAYSFQRDFSYGKA